MTNAGRIFVPYPELKNHGIKYTRVHLNRLIARGLFPSPVQLTPNRIAWILGSPSEADPDTIEGWKATRPMTRVAA